MALVTCFPDADHADWGAPFGRLEGARLRFAGHPEHVVGMELLRT